MVEAEFLGTKGKWAEFFPRFAECSSALAGAASCGLVDIGRRAREKEVRFPCYELDRSYVLRKERAILTFVAFILAMLLFPSPYVSEEHFVASTDYVSIRPAIIRNDLQETETWEMRSEEM